MVGIVGNILNGPQQNQLLAIQRTARTVDEVQLRLATGKDVNSAIDDPDNFFTARALGNEARDLEALLDNLGQSLKTTELAIDSLDSAQKILDTAESYLVEYEKDFVAGNIDLEEILDTSRFIEFTGPGDLISYAGGQDQGTATIIESGFGVALDDNAWKRYAVNYNITANTILEFDFLSTNIPEISGIGFDNDNAISNDSDRFYLYGTQFGGITYAAPIPTYFYDGSSEWVHVEIPVGTFFTGNFSHLTFLDDDDGGGDDGDAQFRNIVIHEGDYNFGQTNPGVSSKYEKEYGSILGQLDLLVKDSHYRGIGLLNDDDLTTFFNADLTSSLTIEGTDASSRGLGLERSDFTTISAVKRKILQIQEARNELRRYATSLAGDYGILNYRNDFTRSTVNVLNAGRDDLTISDQNRDGAQLLALQTRELLQTSTLSLNTSSVLDILS